MYVVQIQVSNVELTNKWMNVVMHFKKVFYAGAGFCYNIVDFMIKP